MTIKGSFILEHPYIKSIFGCKKNVQSKSAPKITGFQKFMYINIKRSYRDSEKGLHYPGRRILTYFAWKSDQGCRL